MEKERKKEENKAKRMAKQIGLLYWPALMDHHGVDPMAFVHAEAILRESDGINEWGNGKECHVSWVWLTPSGVAAMWKAARKRNNEKFRYQVLHRIVAKKGDNLAFLKKYQEGLDWVREWCPNLEDMSRKTIAVIGRVSEEARHTLIGTIKDEHWRDSLRVRDLNWTGVQALEKLRNEGSERSLLIRAALLPPKVAVKLLGLPAQGVDQHPIGQDRVREFCPAYPQLPVAVAGRVALGVSPVAISQGLLSRKEAHQWLLAGGPGSMDEGLVYNSIIDFLIRDLDLEGFIPRNIVLPRWLLHIHARGAWSALLKVHRYPDGRTFRYLDHLDEINQQDLDRGISTGVERAFERSRQRLARLDAEDHRVLCENPFKHLPKWIRLLTTPAELVEEGVVMEHCVGGYSYSVEDDECLILSIVSNHGRSTVEVREGRGGWWAPQHYGYQNTPPPSRHQTLLEAWLNRENQALQNEVR